MQDNVKEVLEAGRGLGEFLQEALGEAGFLQLRINIVQAVMEDEDTPDSVAKAGFGIRADGTIILLDLWGVVFLRNTGPGVTLDGEQVDALWKAGSGERSRLWDVHVEPVFIAGLMDEIHDMFNKEEAR